MVDRKNVAVEKMDRESVLFGCRVLENAVCRAVCGRIHQ